MKVLAVLSLMTSTALFSLQMEPWFGNTYELYWDSLYSYSWYPKVANGIPSSQKKSIDQLLGFNLGVPFSPNWDAEIEVEFVNTPRQSWGFRSIAAQARYLWLNDVSEDPVSFTTGIDIRQVSVKSLADVSCPYHSNFNVESTAALGKEWSHCSFWAFRTFIFSGIGIANHGAAWLRVRGAWQGNIKDRHHYELFAEGYGGLGAKNRVNINHFHGYGNIHHQSLDLGVSYTYLFPVWGSLQVEYIRRLYAHAFPEKTNFLVFRYHLPFSCI